MARNQQFRAQFFVTPEGVAIPKAKPILPSHRYRIYKRDGGRCCECGREVTRHRPFFGGWGGPRVGHVDHIFPRARGGQNDDANLRLLCEHCNAGKAAD